jgi:hypothetical protein
MTTYVDSDSESSSEAKPHLIRWLVLLTASAGDIRGSPFGLPQWTAPSLRKLRLHSSLSALGRYDSVVLSLVVTIASIPLTDVLRPDLLQLCG